MLAYKLLTQSLESHGGLQWTIGQTHTAKMPGTTMCTPQVLHAYLHPLMAVMFNPIHANITKPRLFEIETSEIINQDFAKIACKSQTLLKEIEIPVLTDIQRQEVSIRCAMLIPNPPESWSLWATKWLSGEDRTLKSEERAYGQVSAYAHAHAYACAHACAYAYARACACAYAHAHAYAHAYACACAHACACAYAPSQQILQILQDVTTA